MDGRCWVCEQCTAARRTSDTGSGPGHAGGMARSMPISHPRDCSVRGHHTTLPASGQSSSLTLPPTLLTGWDPVGGGGGGDGQSHMDAIPHHHRVMGSLENQHFGDVNSNCVATCGQGHVTVTPMVTIEEDDTFCQVCQSMVSASNPNKSSSLPYLEQLHCSLDNLADISADDRARKKLSLSRSLSALESLLVPDEFFRNNGIIPVDTNDDKTQNLFVDAFLHNNRLEHMVQVMGYHPEYLECFLKTQQYLLRGDGPLPYDYRHYIAIMAAGRHQCSYLIKIQMTEFLLQGGDERWLKGLENIPQKLRDLYELNKIMAHRPWLISKSHIEKLTRGNDNWSLGELMHAIVLLAHFHSLCSFIYGCGINAEIDHDDGHSYQPPSPNENELACSPEQNCGGGTNHCQPCLSRPPSHPNSHGGSPGSIPESDGTIEELMKKMRRLTENAQLEMTQEELLKRFERVESQSAELPAASKQPSPKADILRFVDDPDFVYQDFARRGAPTEIPTFRAQDYSWEEQGYSLANRLFTDIGTFLDDKFRTAYNLTYNTMGDNTDVDTTSFRRSIWNYIHCMFGIRHDDYDYSEVNHLLERSLKSFIKTVTCFPERVIRKDYDSFMREFKHSEKVHVNLMLLEARMQAELLYSLRAIMRHMT